MDVSTEGGAIKNGDMLIRSSKTGIVIKAGTNKVNPAQVVGKALEDYDANGIGKIKVMVSIK